MAHIYADDTTADYDSTIAKFIDDGFDGKQPFAYVDEDDFKRRVDLSAAGLIQDCGECHAGGGPQEYLYTSDPADPASAVRVPLRNLTSADIPDSLVAVDYTDGIQAGEYTAFNYLMDVYDVDGDGFKFQDVAYVDYAKTGVTEFDCFICHLEGYDYDSRTAAIRKMKLDASRVIGAGIGASATAEDGTAWDTTGYGIDVDYNNSVVDSGGSLALPATFMGRMNPGGLPDSENCAFCHMNHAQVDWKKRGDNWPLTLTSEWAGYEVHWGIGCMGCHERQDEGYEFLSSSMAGTSNQLSLCDPAKGDANFTGMMNSKDNVGFKNCEDCHAGSPDNEYTDPGPDNTFGTADDVNKLAKTYGAPLMDAAHKAAGLTDKIVQSAATGYSGTADASHLDIIDCSACHIRKLATSPDNTGGALVDATGPDHVGRLADHDNENVSREMSDNIAYTWYKGKIIAVNLLSSMYLRDKNDTGWDVNADERGGGMDAALMTHVGMANTNAFGTGDESLAAALSQDGNITTAEMTALLGQVVTDNLAAAVNGGNGSTPAMKAAVLGVPFRVSHGVSPASQAWGAGGCGDCHASGAGFFSGLYETNPTTLTVDLLSNQTAPHTKANGFSQPTDVHPNVKDKFGARSLAFQYFSNSFKASPPVPATLRDIDKSQLLWEENFMTRDTTWYPNGMPISSTAAINFDTANLRYNTKGRFLRVEVKDLADGSIVKRSLKVSGDAVEVADLLTKLTGAANFTGGTFNFTISNNGAGGIALEAAPGYEIRVDAGSDVGFFNLPFWTTKAYAAVDGSGTFTSRAAWVGYLEGLATDGGLSLGVGDDPEAVIASVDGVGVTAAGQEITVNQGASVALVADASTNTAGSYSYTWTFTDQAQDYVDTDGDGVEDAFEPVDNSVTGASASRSFDKVGVWTATLTVLDEGGNKAVDYVKVRVLGAAALTTMDVTLSAGTTGQIDLSTLPAAANTAYIAWGDGAKEWVDLTAATSFTHDFGTTGSFTATVFIYEDTGTDLNFIENVQDVIVL